MPGKVIVIVGPTAVGKSALGVRLAKKFGGEVISADSRQVYKGLDVGTGKITKKEMAGVPHHLLDVAHPRGQFTVAEFKILAEKALHEITTRGHLPIIVGGTGLYIDTLLGKWSIPEVLPDPKLRAVLERKSAEELFAMLQKSDPQRAATIDPHNPRRLIRALEIVQTLGHVPPHSYIPRNVGMTVLYVGLVLPLEKLKERIHERLLQRVQHGMIREAQKLHMQGVSWKRMEALGLEYRYLARYLQNKITRDTMLQELEAEIYRYAKRQLTWFKKNKDVHWFAPIEERKIEALVANFLRS